LRRLLLFLFAVGYAAPALAAPGDAPWWIWPLALFALGLAIGAVAVVAGVGGAVLFVPIVGGFFPFHLDFVRAAGLLLALCGALSAGPGLLREGLASLRLAMPLALVGSITSIAGAMLGFALPVDVMQTALGCTVLAIAALTLWRPTAPAGGAPPAPDALGAALGMHGVYRGDAEPAAWAARRTPGALVAFAGIGLLAGMFGLGAGWANVPVLHLLMGLPLKLSIGTSSFMLSVIDTSAAWVYLHRGAVLPLLAAPSIIGVMIGARFGVTLLRAVPASVARRAVVALLLAAGTRALLKGLGVWT
jgi:uncharacterized membrane protein YfcA